MASSAISDWVHSFDTQRHLILCEAGGFELRSTKHSRNVTCPACLKLLAAKTVPDEDKAREPPHTAA